MREMAVFPLPTMFMQLPYFQCNEQCFPSVLVFSSSSAEGKIELITKITVSSLLFFVIHRHHGTLKLCQNK